MSTEPYEVISDQAIVIKEMRQQLELDDALKESMERQISVLQEEVDLLKLELEDIKPNSSLKDIIKKFTDKNTKLEVQLRRTSFDMLCKNHILRRKLIAAKNELFRCHSAGAHCDSKEHTAVHYEDDSNTENV